MERISGRTRRRTCGSRGVAHHEAGIEMSGNSRTKTGLDQSDPVKSTSHARRSAFIYMPIPWAMPANRDNCHNRCLTTELAFPLAMTLRSLPYTW